MKLFLQAILKFILGVVLVGLLVFLPVGTFNYLGGWILMGILFIPMFIAGIIMMVKNPKLLASRLNAKEKEKKQDLECKVRILGYSIPEMKAYFFEKYNKHVG